MRQARTSGRRRAEVGRRARAVSFREHSNFLVHTHKFAQNRTLLAVNLLSISCFVKTQDFGQIISQSESPSVTWGTTPVPWGWTKPQDTNKGFNGLKSHIFVCFRFLGVKTVSVSNHFHRKKNWSMLEISCCRPLEWALDGICL